MSLERYYFINQQTNPKWHYAKARQELPVHFGKTCNEIIDV